MKKLIPLFVMLLASCISSQYRRGDFIYVTSEKHGVIAGINASKKIMYMDTTYYFMEPDGTWVVPMQMWYIDSINK